MPRHCFCDCLDIDGTSCKCNDGLKFFGGALDFGGALNVSAPLLMTWHAG